MCRCALVRRLGRFPPVAFVLMGGTAGTYVDQSYCRFAPRNADLVGYSSLHTYSRQCQELTPATSCVGMTLRTSFEGHLDDHKRFSLPVHRRDPLYMPTQISDILYTTPSNCKIKTTHHVIGDSTKSGKSGFM